jgi:type II secretory ATPase GspE/PulE/Tfp pilus assembly ATPase PilB-like protein
LVLSTLHTNSAAGALTRLADMGLEPYRIAASVTAVLAQRLVRTLCLHCRTPAKGDDGEAAVYEAAGCERCGGTGYYGRTLIAEVMIIDEALRALILQGKDLQVIEKAALAGGLQPMRQNGLDKVAQGKTSIAEIMRVLGNG